ncbi:putative transmembrane protein [Gregarina niphandrodes]|uniref:Transmembrane protein n=1 Tax=Gregarina niphandrodes TaxID=110365 RepID=A0A023B3D0_GRENI|nr:putative transmembrane protein [Gregarina niphandrodes]EZG55490.1 putative transmembrane protein [Gregarina niphandrodes]|eukprot:XP_011131534.1 putative transmembrane protein [Gregarina niphandrodes]
MGSGGLEEEKIHSRRSTALLLVNASAGLEGCDDQMLPSSFRALECDLHFTPKMLGKISMVQSLAMSLSCPLWGFCSDRLSRRYVLGFGCLMWGVTTTMLASSSTYQDIRLLRTLNGIFLGCIGPVSQSVLADFSPGGKRGLTFGLIQLSANLGRVFGGVLTTALGRVTMFTALPLLAGNGVHGWRVMIGLVGLFSVLLGLCITNFMPLGTRQRVSALTLEEQQMIARYHQRYGTNYADHTLPVGGTAPVGATRAIGISGPAVGSGPGTRPVGGRVDAVYPTAGSHGLNFVLDVVKYSMTRASIVLVVLEGFIGSIPWSGLAFVTMFYQYCGLTDFAAGIASGMLLVGGMIGGPVGGLIGDHISRTRSPNHGRPLMAQVSMILRLPIVFILLKLTPRSQGSFAAFAAMSFLLGLSSFAGAAVNRPIMTEVVLPEHRATAFAIAIAIEGVCSAFFGAPLVGWLAEHRYGYHPTGEAVEKLDEAHRQRNADSLANAIFVVTIVPWFISLVLYSLLHLTYGPDKRKNEVISRARSLIRANIPGLNPDMRSSSVRDFLHERLAT